MAIDSSILLQGRPVQVESPLNRLAQLTALKNQQVQAQQNQAEAPLRMQALQQQVQGGGIQLQQEQQNLKDQQAGTQALQDWDGKDVNSIIGLAQKHGASAQWILAKRKDLLDQQHQAAETFKAQADAGKAQVETLKQKGDLINGALAPLTDPDQVPDAALGPTLTSTVQDLVNKKLLDQQHADAAIQLLQSGDSTKIRQGIKLFTNTNMAQSQILENAYKDAQTAQANAEATKIKASTDPNSPLYSPSAAAVAMGTAPGAAQIQAGEAKLAGSKAAAEAAARQPFEMALSRQRQALSQGDPAAAGKLLVDGDATLSELKARGATPEFIQQTLNAAKQMSGGKYNAQAADAQFKVAQSPTNLAFFGSAKSLTDPGGTLEQLATVAKKLPSNQIPAFNTIADWEKAATGNGPLAQYAASALAFADDYSKVMGGGQGSDASRMQALNLIPKNASPEARAGAILGSRNGVMSQIKSRIGKNQVLQRMYGDTAEQQPASGGDVHPFFQQFGGVAK